MQYTSLFTFPQNHYYPFGLTMVGISSKAAGSLINKYKYNGKEQQSQEFSEGTEMGEYDYGARQYSSQVGRWFSLDILAEKYFGMTPYNYVLNNPVNFLDYDGMDVYIINADGKVLLAKKEDKPDMLRAVDKNGNFIDVNKDKAADEKDGIIVNTKGMLNQLTEIRKNSDPESTATMFSIVADNDPTFADDLLNIFHYVSNNTNVEFSLTYYKHKDRDLISLATFKSNTSSPGSAALGISEFEIYKKYHNHPPPIVNSERWSMGQNKNGEPFGGDFLKLYDEVKYSYYVYFPLTTNLYQIKQKSIELVQQINNDYRKLKK